MAILTELLKLNQDALIELFELDLSTLGINTIYRFTSEIETNGQSVSFRGQKYDALPIEASGFEYTSKAPFPRPNIKVSNITGGISALLVLYQDLTGAKMVRRRTLIKYLDGHPNGTLPEELHPDIYFIERKTEENELYVNFELVSGIEMAGLQIPARRVTRRCTWKYRGVECAYTSQAYFNEFDQPVSDPRLDKCGHRLSSCKVRFGANNELPFGGFPTVDVSGGSY